ncbi:unnamed protein product [Pedinophyceae sp. YPF-701]|nr:unnamed protein product [Pedinophyceae sp. YPF-701]
MYERYRQKDFADVPDMSAQDLVSVLQAGDRAAPVVVDVRQAAERAVSRIPGSVFYRDFSSSREQYRGRPVVVHCTLGVRSAWLAQGMLRDGWDVRNLAGGILSYTHAGGPLEADDGQRTTRVHTFSKKWALQAPGYEPVAFRFPYLSSSLPSAFRWKPDEK